MFIIRQKGQKVSYLIHLLHLATILEKKVRSGEQSNWCIYCLINLLIKIIQVSDHLSNEIVWKRKSGVAIGHFVKFGGHFEKAPPVDKFYMFIYHLTNL